jgi:tRNA (mo5U34)-methyltransferase
MLKTLQSQLLSPKTETESAIARMGPWFHNLHLPDGTQTAPDHPLGDFPSFKWQQLKDLIPADLEGWQILDIGCNSGFYSYELAKRGATVTAIDMDEHYLRQARWAAKQYGLESKITFKQMGLYDLARCEETYDLVWFMGVLYHLRYPLLGLDIVSRKVKRLLVIQSLTTNDPAISTNTDDLKLEDINRMSQPGWPAMAFVENELFGDPTNWWLSNEAGLQAMLRTAGMQIQEHPAPGTYICAPDAATPFQHGVELEAATGSKRI